MSYPTYRQDFEAGSTLATACPELTDFTGGKFGINTSPANSLTGNNSLQLLELTTSWNILNTAADSLAGNVVFTCYFKCGYNLCSASFYARGLPLGSAAPTTNVRALFGGTGLVVSHTISGTATNLNAPIAGVTLPTGVWLCLEIRSNGTTVSARVVRQDTGQYFVHAGSGSWSATPQGQSGTTTVTGAGTFGFRGSDTVYLYQDDWIVEPAVPAIDIPTFTLSSIGATQQLTAGGFTDPLFGVTWGSSNTGIATVSATGLVTAVASGTATITATGKRDTGQTATAVATVATVPATVITSTPPTPASGYAHNPSAPVTFAVGTGTVTGSIVVTPTDAGGGGTFTPPTLTLTNTTRSGTCTYTPGSAAVFGLTCTNSGGLTNPAPFNYTANAQALAVSPTTFQVGVAQTAAFTGTGTLWLASPPTFTAAGIPCTVGAASVTSNTACTALITPGTTQGTVTFADSTSGALATATVGPVIPIYTYLASVLGFASGLAGTVGYTILDATGTTYAVRATAGVFAIGSAGYGARVSIPNTGQYAVVWDDGSGHQTFEVTPPYAGGPVASVTAPITLPALPPNWITAAGIAAGALAAKGDWLTATAYVVPPSVAAVATAVLTTQTIESYNADGVAPTLTQFLYLVMQRLTDFQIVGNQINVRKLDGTNTAYQLTLDSATAATSSTRSS